MSEQDTVNQTPDQPATVHSLQTDLAALGVTPGMLLLVHSSLSTLGWVCGGSVALILALEEVLGGQGTLVMPTHSSDLSDPAQWENPPVPSSWWDTIRATMPAFDPDLTPTRAMGRVPETFRKQRGVLRSSHPQFSFAAWGAQARTVTENHTLAHGLGEGSPLARVYDLHGWVLLLGVGHDRNTSLHLAEYGSAWAAHHPVERGMPVLVEGRRQWLTVPDIDGASKDFDRMGEDFQRHSGLVRHGRVAEAKALLMPQRELVDYAVSWIDRHR